MGRFLLGEHRLIRFSLFVAVSAWLRAYNRRYKWGRHTARQVDSIGQEMILHINDRFRITSDSRQWIIQQARTRNGHKSWQSKWFFPTFESALRELGQLMVRTSKAQTLVDALDDVEKITTTLSQALTPQFERIYVVPEEKNS